MTTRTRAQLNADADTNLADNTAGDISAADVRQRIKDLADSARLAEDVGTMAAQGANAVAITGGTVTGITDLAIADGGTGQGTAAAAFTALKQAATTTATGVVEKADASEIAAATADKFPDAAGVLSAMAFAAITAGSAPAVNHAAGVNQKITHSANATMGAPSNSKPGWPLNIWIVPGAFTTAWNAVYKFDGSTPTITAEGIACFICLDASNFVYLGFRKKV